MVEEKAYPPEIVLTGDEEPRIGVFICSCGSNIAGVVDVGDAVEHARVLPQVVHVENTIYTCSADSLALIQERIAEHGLNRVIVASCTPRTHEPIFREGHCWEHFLKEKMDEWDAQDAERQTCLEGVGYVFGDSLDTGWLAEEVCR